MVEQKLERRRPEATCASRQGMHQCQLDSHVNSPSFSMYSTRASRDDLGHNSGVSGKGESSRSFVS